MGWTQRFFDFVKNKEAEAWSPHDIEAFLNYLALEKQVSFSTQKQALNAVIFFFRHVLTIEPGDFSSYQKARSKKRLPQVLSQEEVARLIDNTEGVYRLMAMLQYGTGLRLNELIQLRIKDVDFERMQVFVREGKGGKDRILPLPEDLIMPLKEYLLKVHTIFNADRQASRSGVYLPNSLEKKYPKASVSWPWFWLWPSKSESVDPRTQVFRRHHAHPGSYQRHLQKAAQKAKIPKQMKSHLLRHSYATHLLEQGTHVRVLQELLGHTQLETTQIYLHVMNTDTSRVVSPLSFLKSA